MPTNKSLREELLEASSPVLTLVIILSVIAGLLLVVFLSWVKFRRRVVDPLDSQSTYNVLIGEPTLTSSYAGPDDPNCAKYASDSMFTDGELGNGSISLPDLPFPESVIIELGAASATSAENVKTSRPPAIHKDALPQLSMEVSTSDLSIDALVSSHKRLVEQRERFVRDVKHLGLRHMALEHLRLQQKYEKQIMALKLRVVQTKQFN
jgi:hypothetical protein